ncbi:MAG: GNAT family N-acetyltransferase [Pseudonocardia sp.]|nr:GNAT family N-acetyltransferase [Pseudonocardia sp.]
MHPAAEELRAGPVTLRRWRADDADELYRIVCESLPHLAPWMAWAASGYADTDAREHLTQAHAAWVGGVDYHYAITDRVGALIGSCSMMGRIGPGGMEIGYWLHPAHTGRGYATAAAAALTAEAFRIGADRVEIVHDTANVRSGAIPRRLGFTEVTRRPAQGAMSSGEAGADLVWRRTP